MLCVYIKVKHAPNIEDELQIVLNNNMYSLDAGAVEQQQHCAYGKPQCLVRDAASSVRYVPLQPHSARVQNIVSE